MRGLFNDAAVRLMWSLGGVLALAWGVRTGQIANLFWVGLIPIGMSFVGLVFVPTMLHRAGYSWPQAFVRAITHGDV